MRKLELREIQLEELKMLKMFIDICKKYNLNYSLMGGTLLGAVRHKGFIPWDDDVDVFMPRPDYENLKSIIKKGKLDFDDFEFISKDLGNGKKPFIKFINKNIVVEEKVQVDKYLWIDIFPMDGVPNDEKEAQKFLNKVFFLIQCFTIKQMNFKNIFKSSKNLKRRIIKILLKPVLFFRSEESLVKKIMELSTKYDYNTSKYVANVAWVDIQRKFFEKKDLEEYITINFEDIKDAKCFKNYNIYLEKNYGDYMKLPPENQRYSHNFDAWYIEDEKKGSK